MTTFDHARFLMCRPEHFAVSYTINPSMDPRAGRAISALTPRRRANGTAFIARW